MLVVAGVTYTFVVGPTFIVALLAIMYAARYERGISRR
jgi:hypothetical protein